MNVALTLFQAFKGTSRVLILSAALLTLGSACNNLDLDGLELGAECNGDDSSCRSGQCFEYDSATSVCTASCSENADCPKDFLCDRSPSHGQLCLPLGLGGRCNEGEQCPAGHLCDTSENRCYIPVHRELCDPCSSSQQCPDGGSCLEIPVTGERYCTVPCEGGCPSGFRCESVPGAAKEQCVADNELRTCGGGRELCAPCESHTQCGLQADLCVRNLSSQETFCGKSCGANSDCPSGFSCTDLSGDGRGPNQCVPNSYTCAGYCSSGDELKVRMYCGLGASCEVEESRCIPARDGRACAQCEDDDDCSATPGSRCLVNECPDCPFQGEKYCATSCMGENGPDQSRCSLGFECVSWEEGEAACVPSSGTCQGGAGRLGDECTGRGGAGCVSGVCLGYGNRSLCSAFCADDSECGDPRYGCCQLLEDEESFDCNQAPENGKGVCAPRGGGFGADCSPGQPPCFQGACLDLGTSLLCTLNCEADGDCPEHFSCREARRGGAELETEALKVCFPDGGGDLGSDCTFGPAACKSGYCIKKRSGNLCTESCSDNESCPGGWECRDQETVDGNRAQVCVRSDLVNAR